MNDAYALYKMAVQLKDDIINIINNQLINVESAKTHVEMYNQIRNNVLIMFPSSSIAKSIPYVSMIYSISLLPPPIPETKPTFINLLSATGQIISFLATVSEDPDAKIGTLNNQIKLLEEKNFKLEEVNKLTSESLNKYIKAEEFPVSEEKVGKIPKDILPTLHDALRAYGAGSYTACVCVCRNIIQGLVEEQCAKEGIKENGLNKKIEALISTKKIKQKHNQTLLDTVATLGHRSAHPTTEVFTKEKAALVLNGLLILIDEVFT